MRTNATVTVYNRKLNKASRLDEWHKTVIQDANFYIDTKVTVGDKILASANDVKIRIPTTTTLENNYIDEDAWTKTTDVTGKWTLQADDYVCKGEGPDITSPKDLKHGYKIISWSDNRDSTNPHWRVGGA